MNVHDLEKARIEALKNMEDRRYGWKEMYMAPETYCSITGITMEEFYILFPEFLEENEDE